MSDTIRVILMGTGPFAVPSFEAIDAADYEIVEVIVRPSPPVKSRGGPPPRPVHDWAIRKGYSVWEPESINDEDAIGRLVENQADLMVVCDYGQILKREALEATRWGGINLHGSLLPAYRGAAPVQRALLSGDTETGVSVIHMTPRLDGGPIVATAKTAIRSTETSGELEERLSELGVEATLAAIKTLASQLADHEWGNELPLIGEIQDAGQVSKAPRLSKAEAEIDWNRAASEIDCLVRGMQPWPVAFTYVTTNPDKPAIRVAIRKVTPDLTATVSESQVGCLLETESKHEIAVGCGHGRLILERLQPAGKKEMDASEFVRGHRLEVGARFGV